MLSKFRDFILDLLFPVFCQSCGREGDYLCQDCLSTLEISQYQYCLCKSPQRVIEKGKCPRCFAKKLSGLYFAIDYRNPLIKNLIQRFKYEPFLKELAKPLAFLIITHFQLLEKPWEDFADFILIPIPLEKKRLKWRGFNQAEEIAKELSNFLKIPIVSDLLIKTKANQPQVELPAEVREENVKETFLINPVRKEWRIWNPVRKCWFSNGVKNPEKIKGGKILLVDDVYATGSTMEESARILKEAGAGQVWGVVVSRAKPGEGKFQNV